MDPKHPTKIVVVVKGGEVVHVLADKEVKARVFVAEYWGLGPGLDENLGSQHRDARGEVRLLREIEPIRDTVEIRAVLNKRKGGEPKS